MSSPRSTRSTSNFKDIPVQHLQLPTRIASGQSASPGILSPSNPQGSGRGRGLSPRVSPRPGTAQTPFTFNSVLLQSQQFEDASNSSTAESSTPSTMATLIPVPGPDASTDEIRKYAEQMREQALAFSQSLASTTQLLQQALVTNTNRGVSSKKPELPPFDSKNIEPWIRRTENAFLRVGISDPKLKFAHLESVISVELHPTVNEYFNGDATQDNYDSLLKFLRDRYGRTLEQQVQSAIQGIRRNGRLPTDLVAAFDDQMGKVTLDDIKKEHLLNELPETIRTQLADRVTKLNYKELAVAADEYFDRDGTLRSNNYNSVNNINNNPPSAAPPSTGRPSAQQPVYPSNFTTAFGEEYNADTDINAVNRPRNGGSSNTNNGHPRTPSNQRGNRAGSRNRPQSRTRSSSRGPRQNPAWCWYHNKHGQEAKNCQQPCNFVSNGSQQGNARGGRH